MLLNKLEWAQRSILIICNLAIMIIVVASFLARYLFSLDFYGAEEILLVFAFWLYFIGAAGGPLKNRISRRTLSSPSMEIRPPREKSRCYAT